MSKFTYRVYINEFGRYDADVYRDGKVVASNSTSRHRYSVSWAERTIDHMKKETKRKMKTFKPHSNFQREVIVVDNPVMTITFPEDTLEIAEMWASAEKYADNDYQWGNIDF